MNTKPTECPDAGMVREYGPPNDTEEFEYGCPECFLEIASPHQLPNGVRCQDCNEKLYPRCRHNHMSHLIGVQVALP